MSLPKILVTGFGPFPGVRKNPSAVLATKIIRSRRLTGFARIDGAVIPTVYDEVFFTFRKMIEAEKPDAILMFGVAARTTHLRIETRARNYAGQFYPDAEGRKAPQTLILHAPNFLRVNAPVETLAAAVRATGIAARTSTDAGRYICNAALFTALDTVARMPKKPPTVFVHIPMPKRCGRAPDPRPTAAQLRRAGEAIVIALARAID
jgi:pyroglutamyl-peptidase